MPLRSDINLCGVWAVTGFARSRLGSFALLTTLNFSAAAVAQTASYTIDQQAAVAVPKVTAPQVVQPPLVDQAAQPLLIDPARAMSGATLLAALRKGGFNLYMRHAQSNVGQDQDLASDSGWWQKCAMQRNISDAGREQARKVGAAIRALSIPVGEVMVSQFCRVRDTGAAMGFGAMEVSEDLNHMIGQRVGTDVNGLRFKRLAAAPAKGRNNLLISHTHASAQSQEQIMQGIQEAEIVVYQPDGRGGAEPVARISMQEWDSLLVIDSKKQALAVK